MDDNPPQFQTGLGADYIMPKYYPTTTCDRLLEERNTMESGYVSTLFGLREEINQAFLECERATPDNGEYACESKYFPFVETPNSSAELGRLQNKAVWENAILPRLKDELENRCKK